jgi:hypothetical protein
MNPTVNPVNSSGPADRPDYAGGARNGELVRDNVRGGFAWIEKSGFNGTNFGRIKGTRQHAERELEGAPRFTFQLFLKSICRRRLFSGSL